MCELAASMTMGGVRQPRPTRPHRPHMTGVRDWHERMTEDLSMTEYATARADAMRRTGGGRLYTSTTLVRQPRVVNTMGCALTV